MHERWSSRALMAVALGSLVCLTACGGGGSSGPPPPPPPPPGTLDSSFGVGGIVSTPDRSPPPGASVSAIAVQPDGKLIAAGSSLGVFVRIPPPNTPLPALVRYNADGTLDGGFGAGGVFTLTPDAAPSLLGAGAFRAVALQPDGRIVAAGSVRDKCILARANADGRLDATFGDASSGFVLFDTYAESGAVSHCTSIAFQPDGKIIVGGGKTQDQVDTNPTLGFWLARVDAHGHPDLSFGDGHGQVRTVVLDRNGSITAMTVKPDGAVVTVGGEQDYFEVVQFDVNGQLDASFGTTGVATASIGNYIHFANGVALQADGRIVVAGCADRLPDQHVVLARFSPAGSTDPGFGVNGMVDDTQGNCATAVAVQANGKIVTIGYDHGSFDARVTRYLAAGAMDVQFGAGGVARPPMPKEQRAIAIQPDGRIVVAGGTELNFGSGWQGYFAIARVFGDPVASGPP
jgi:uncharacterized delta-60 repeat protein